MAGGEGINGRLPRHHVPFGRAVRAFAFGERGRTPLTEVQFLVHRLAAGRTPLALLLVVVGSEREPVGVDGAEHPDDPDGDQRLHREVPGRFHRGVHRGGHPARLRGRQSRVGERDEQ